jgi:hypothetical protein
VKDQEHEAILAVASVSGEEFAADIAAVRWRLLRFEGASMVTQLVAQAFAEHRRSGSYRFPEVEFAALVYWFEPTDMADARIPTPQDVAETLSDLSRLFGQVTLLQHSTDDGRSDTTPMAKIIRTIRSNGLRIRVPAYPVHQRAVLDGLFAPYERDLEAAFGFSAHEAADCFSAFYDIYNVGVKRSRSEYTDADAADRVRGFANCVTFDAETVAQTTGIERSRIAAILEVFSLKRGEPDCHALRPSPLSQLRSRPLLALGNGRYIAPNMDLLLYAVQPRLEALMKQGYRALFKRYERRRASWLESEVLRVLAEALPGGVGTTGAYYPHEGGLTEADVVYKVDDVVYLVECKAGVFRDSAMRGSPDQLPRDIVDIITEGHEQATRAECYIAAGNRTFYDRSGRLVRYSLSGEIREIFRLVVTLAPVGGIATASKALHEAAFLPGAPSWIVPFTDLMIVNACMTVPGEFRCYTRARTASLCDDTVLASDETDYLGTYGAANTLAFPGVATILPDFSRDFDDFFLERGAKVPPGLRLPPDLKALADALARTNRAMWSHAVCDMITLPGRLRQMLAERIARCRKAWPGAPSDFAVGDADIWAVTIIVDKDTSPMEMQRLYAERFFRRGTPVRGKRLVVAYNVAREEAIAHYYWGGGDERLRFAPPSVFWSSTLTRS